MNNEKQRILNLFKEGKITSTEFRLLNDALDNKNSFISRIYGFMVDPFPRISGKLAFLLTIVFTFGQSILAWYCQFHFQGLFDHDEIPLGKHMGYQYILLELIVGWLLISLVFWLSALCLRIKSY
ncbi:MAG TPA: hypothetical protein VKR58_13310, partial [Aquella sp.]|nr:hypothetical protein [Aquella sp.]